MNLVDELGGHEDWQRVSTAFADLLDVSPTEREQQVAILCRGANDVEREVRRLLLEHGRAGQFLETPALGELSTGKRGPEPERVFLDEDVLANRFQVVRLLGIGGMGEVYEAMDLELRQRVAIKTLHALGGHDPVMVGRFRTEVLRSRLITHPNVGRVYDLFTHRFSNGFEVPFFTMELLGGETLSHWIADHGPFSSSEALPLVEQMAAALHAAHSVGIVHRDFKPGNVFISLGVGQTIKAVVTDFGIAAEFGSTSSDLGSTSTSPTGLSLLGGTPAYMAPEQIAGDDTSPAADVYALGLVVYEMLTARQAYESQSPLVCALKKLSLEDPVLLFSASGVPDQWIHSIHRSVRRNPQDRFADPLEFAASLAPKEQASPRILLFQRFWVALLLALSLALAVVFLAGRLTRDSAPPSASIAVLPFANLSGDPQMSYFSDGLAEELAHALTGYSKLHVAAQSAASGYRSGSTPPQKISRDLGVEMLLMGSVRRSESRLHVSVQLVRGATGRQVWSQIYDRDFQQVFAVQDEITTEVAARLTAGPAARKAGTEPTSNLEAYDHYLRGRYLWNTRTREGLLKGLGYFDEAIRLDTNFALAYTALADSYTVLADYAWISPIEAAPKIRSGTDEDSPNFPAVVLFLCRRSAPC